LFYKQLTVQKSRLSGTLRLDKYKKGMLIRRVFAFSKPTQATKIAFLKTKIQLIIQNLARLCHEQYGTTTPSIRPDCAHSDPLCL
jgi:hypothetical protein